MAPTIGRTVLYKLSHEDAEAITRRRKHARDNWQAMRDAKTGYQAHAGQSSEEEGNVFPMIITRVWDETMVNGQVLLDGSDSLWATSVHLGDEAGQWNWPPRVES